MPTGASVLRCCAIIQPYGNSCRSTIVLVGIAARRCDIARDRRASRARFALGMAALSRVAGGKRAAERWRATPRWICPEHTAAHGPEACLLRGQDLAGDFLSELEQPLKRRIGMRYSNEFYFVTPAALVHVGEIPADCGLVEAGYATVDEWQQLIGRHAGFFNYDPDRRAYCMITVPAPWRDTPGPT